MKTFYVGVKGVIVQNSKVLLVRSNPNHENSGDRWEMPGGRMDNNESIEQTLRRELSEELLNIADIKIDKLLGVHRVHKDVSGEISLVLIYYKVTAKFDSEPKLSIEHTEYKWADKTSILQLVPDASQVSILKALN